MKRILLLLKIMLICGCTDNSVVDMSQDDSGNIIKFNVSVRNPKTKALVEHEAEMNNLGFFGYRYTPDKSWPADCNDVETIMANAKLSYSGSDEQLWEYENEPYYWGPGAGTTRFSFFGIAPYDEGVMDEITSSTTKGLVLSYDASQDRTLDLMVASTTNIYPPLGGIVTLNFGHALSALSFTTDDYSKIAKVRLVCTALHPKGDVTVSGRPSWELSEALEDFEYVLYDQSTNTDEVLMLIPQSIAENSIVVHVTSSQGVEKILELSPTTFEAGKRYVLKIKTSYFEVEEDGSLVIDMSGYNDWVSENPDADWNDYSVINEILDKIKANAEASGEDITLKLINAIKDAGQAYHLITHIVDYMHVDHFDFSGLILPSDGKMPHEIFGSQNPANANKVVKSIKLPVLTSNNQLDAGFVANCTALETLEFASGSTITKFPYALCTGCTSLKNVDLTALTKLEAIDQVSFQGCTSLEAITVPKSVTLIGQNAFNGCASLETLAFETESTLKTIDQYAFNGCTSFKYVSLPASLEGINPHVFDGCSNLETVSFDAGSNLKTIGQQTFNNCSQLKRINIPSSVESFAWQTFNGCVALKNYNAATGDGVYFECAQDQIKNIKSLVNGFNGSGVDVSKL